MHDDVFLSVALHEYEVFRMLMDDLDKNGVGGMYLGPPWTEKVFDYIFNNPIESESQRIVEEVLSPGVERTDEK